MKKLSYGEVANFINSDNCLDEAELERLKLLMGNCLQDIYAQCSDSHFYHVKFDFTTVPFQNEYDIASLGETVLIDDVTQLPIGQGDGPLGRIVSVVGPECCTLEEVCGDEAHKWRCSEDCGKPEFFERFGDTISLYPIPDKEYTYTFFALRDLDCEICHEELLDPENPEAGTVTVWDYIDLPVNFHNVLAKHVRAMWYGHREDWLNAGPWFDISSNEFDIQKELHEKRLLDPEDDCNLIKIGGKKKDCECPKRKDPYCEPAVVPVECRQGNAMWRRSHKYSVRDQGEWRNPALDDATPNKPSHTPVGP